MTEQSLFDQVAEVVRKHPNFGRQSKYIPDNENKINEKILAKIKFVSLESDRTD